VLQSPGDEGEPCRTWSVNDASVAMMVDGQGVSGSRAESGSESPLAPVSKGEARRWDSDTRLVGIADAHPIAGDVRRLARACTEAGWIAEDANIDLGPHLQEACDAPGPPWHWMVASQRSDDTYVVDVEHTPTTSGEVWEDAVRLLSTVAENSFHVRRVDDHTVECITGVLPGDSSFAPHGHTIRLRIR
jgi:hypothetical protein